MKEKKEIMERPKNIREVVKNYLVENGFDGLSSDCCQGCEIDDLAHCDDSFDFCVPGYKVTCDSVNFGFYISAIKS